MKKLTLLLMLLLIVNLFGKNNTQVREYDLEDWMSIKNCNYVTSVCEGRDYIYFGTNGGVIPFHKYEYYEEPAYTTSDGLADDYITAVFYDNSTQYLWAAHRKGISYLSPTDEAWTNKEYFNQYDPQVVRIGNLGKKIVAEMSDQTTMTLYKSNDFDGDSGINSTKWSRSASSQPIVVNGAYTTNSGYWVRNDGIVQDNDLREFPWNLKFIGPMNKLYGGVLGLGYIVGEERMQSFDIYQTGMLKNFVNTFVLTDDYLWTASDDAIKASDLDRSGISRMDFETGEWEYFEDELIYELASGRVSEIDADDNILVAGTDEGLTTYDMAKDRWRRFSVHDQLWSDVINSVSIDSNYAMIGTEFGLNVLNLFNNHIDRIELSKVDNLVKIFKVTHDNNQFWIGTDNGIFSVKMKNDELKHFDFYGKETEIDRVIASNCYSISSDGNRTVFFGDNFFLMYNLETGNWSDLPDFFGDAFVFDMDLDGDWLWLGTDEGAKLLNIKTNEWEEYHVIDGLAGKDVMKVLIDGDWVWFGTDKGLTKYNWRKYVLE